MADEKDFLFGRSCHYDEGATFWRFRTENIGGINRGIRPESSRILDVSGLWRQAGHHPMGVREQE
jgi:hypothetical protein